MFIYNKSTYQQMYKNQIKHRNAIKNFFITFPQSLRVSKQSFVEKITNLYKANKYICVEEKHEDGNPHIHLAIVLETPVTKYQLLQHITEVYPTDYKRIDIQSMRSLKLSTEYLTSPDKNKYVDPEPMLYNITLEDKVSRLHRLFTEEFKDDPILSWANECACPICDNLIKEQIQKDKDEINKYYSEKDEIIIFT